MNDWKTGSPPPALMQDDCRALSLWFSSRLGARYLLVCMALAGCGHQVKIVQQPVACITERVERDPKQVTNAQLKAVPKARPDRYIALATARINQDEDYIGKLEAQVDGCAKISSTSASAP